MLAIHDGARGPFTVGGSRALALPPGACGWQLVRDKSVIFLFLHGGPSQVETFDPKMTAPEGIRSITGEVATTLPGVTFGGSFPKLAKLADKVSIVRSYVPGNANHDIKPIVCKDTLGGNLGSIYARAAGVNHPATGMPSNVILFPQAVDPSTRPGTMLFGKFGDPGSLGAACAPFDPSGAGDLRKDMRLTLPLDRLDDRRALLTQLDRVKMSLSDAKVRRHGPHSPTGIQHHFGSVASVRSGEGEREGVGAATTRPRSSAGEHRQEVEELQFVRR